MLQGHSNPGVLQALTLQCNLCKQTLLPGEHVVPLRQFCTLGVMSGPLLRTIKYDSTAVRHKANTVEAEVPVGEGDPVRIRTHPGRNS